MEQVITYDTLLKRAQIFLEDGEWNKAREYCEKVLDLNPECGDAYALIFLISKKVKSVEALKNTFKNKIEKISPSKFILNKDKKHIEEIVSKYVIPNYLSAEEIEVLYNEVTTFQSKTNILAKPLKEEEFYWNNKDFEKVLKYRDGELSERLIQAKEDNLAFIHSEIQKEKEDYNFKLEDAKQRYAVLIEEADKKAFELYNNALERKTADEKEAERKELERIENVYNQANALLEIGRLLEFKKSRDMFKSISDYKDSKEKIEYCEQKINELKERI